MMKTKRFYHKYIVGTLVLFTVVAFVPVKDHLSHPKMAEVAFDEGIQVPVKLSVWWYDRGLNKKDFGEFLEFDANRQVQIPDTLIPTSLWRLVLKRMLTPFDKWTECENCYGPNVVCSLRLKDNYHPPEKMRLAQNKSEKDGIIAFRVSLIPNEAKYEVREFKPDDLNALLVEAKKLISEGNINNIPNSNWGSELTKVNPVRVECRDSVLILWMGGKVGYVISPDKNDCPVLNMTFTSGTEFSHVFKLEKM
jgi:hypothetical protein